CSVLLVLVLLSVFATVPSKLFAQSATTGLISGTVTDPSGAIVAGASVTLSQRTTNATQSTLTDSAGRYVFPAVNPSDYTLTFSAKGFENAVTNELHVEVLKSYTINITLQVGAASQTVTVTDVETAELQTTSATVGAVLGGARDEQVTFSFDGGDVTSDLEGSNTYAAPPGEPSPSPVVPIPIESTQEFQVSTTNPNATFGRSSGGQVALLTKSGNNSFHGSAYEYHNDDALNANSWTNNRLGINRPQSVDN